MITGYLHLKKLLLKPRTKTPNPVKIIIVILIIVEVSDLSERFHDQCNGMKKAIMVNLM